MGDKFSSQKWKLLKPMFTPEKISETLPEDKESNHVS